MVAIKAAIEDTSGQRDRIYFFDSKRWAHIFMQISTKHFYQEDKDCTDELVYPDIECDSDLAMEELYKQLKGEL